MFASMVQGRDEDLSRLSGQGVAALGEAVASTLAKADTIDDNTVVIMKLFASSSTGTALSLSL